MFRIHRKYIEILNTYIDMLTSLLNERIVRCVVDHP